MKIGIVGLGVVGNACKFGFEKEGHAVSFYDIRFPDTSVDDVLDTKIVFVCVPTPSREDGSCDTSIVEEVISKITERFQEKLNRSVPLIEHKLAIQTKAPIIAIKSTVAPGTIDTLSKKFRYYKFAFVPEFLRERCAITDFTENHDVCIIGTFDAEAYSLIKEAHGSLPQKFIKLTPQEAEFCKYFNNVYNATIITFANSFYEICKKFGVNYTNVKNAMTNRKHIHSHYLECNDNFRGFAGMCLPKDTKALAALSKGTDVKFFDRLIEENEKYVKTVPEGMRK